MLFCHAAVVATVRKGKTMKIIIEASLPKIGSFPRCLTSYFSIIKVFIFHSRNTISSPISLNRQRGQLNIPTNFDQSIDNGIFSQEKHWKSLLHMRWKAAKIKRTVTSKFQCLKWKEFMAEKFSIFIGKDLEEIHPQYFCHACYAHPDRRSIVPVTWVTHYDDDCRVCSHVEEIRKVEGPRRYEGGENPDSLTSLQLFSPPVRSKILTLLPQTVPSTDSLWWIFREVFPSRKP